MVVETSADDLFLLKTGCLSGGCASVEQALYFHQIQVIALNIEKIDGNLSACDTKEICLEDIMVPYGLKLFESMNL